METTDSATQKINRGKDTDEKEIELSKEDLQEKLSFYLAEILPVENEPIDQYLARVDLKEMSEKFKQFQRDAKKIHDQNVFRLMHQLVGSIDIYQYFLDEDKEEKAATEAQKLIKMLRASQTAFE